MQVTGSILQRIPIQPGNNVVTKRFFLLLRHQNLLLLQQKIAMPEVPYFSGYILFFCRKSIYLYFDLLMLYKKIYIYECDLKTTAARVGCTDALCFSWQASPFRHFLEYSQRTRLLATYCRSAYALSSKLYIRE